MRPRLCKAFSTSVDRITESRHSHGQDTIGWHLGQALVDLAAGQNSVEAAIFNQAYFNANYQ
ncbi:hypothetical protein ABIF50_001624 [Bradyrhizobium diazoefficiens]